MARVTIPLLLKDVTGGQRRAEVDGTTLAEVIRALDARFPGLEAIVRQGNRLNPMVVCTIDGAIASRGLATPVCPDSEVCFLPSMGGG